MLNLANSCLYIPNLPPSKTKLMHQILLLDQQRPLASSARIIDRTFCPGEDSQIIDERATESPSDIRSPGSPDPPGMFLLEHLTTPAGHEGNQSRTEVTRAVEAPAWSVNPHCRLEMSNSPSSVIPQRENNRTNQYPQDKLPACRIRY
jgi:hypothetical protein